MNDGTLKFDTSIDSSGFQKGISTIGSIAQKGLAATTAIFTGATAAIGTIGAAAIKVGSDFESAMSKVEAISGASGAELQALTEKAKEMGSTTKFSATESAEAFEYMAMAGWKTEDMLSGIEGIMNLAAASGTDLATTSDIVTDALTAFGMQAADSAHFADILAAASSNANTNVEMMGETFKYVAPVAGALGFTAEDTATAIGLMANAGIKSSQAGTSLRAMMSRLAKPTKEVQTAMNALGVSLTDEEGNMKSLNEIMIDLREGFAGLSEAEAAEMASSLAGKEAMSGMLAIVNASDEDFNKLTNSIYTCDGAAAQMAETMNDNLQGQITILKSGLEGLGISLYENMQAPCTDIVKTAQDMVQQLQTAFNEGGFDGLVSSIGDVLTQVIQKIAEAAPTLINAAVQLVGSFCDGLKSNPGIAEAASELIAALISGLAECYGDIYVTAIVLISKLAEGIAAGAPEMVSAIFNALTDITETISDFTPDLVYAAAEIVAAIAQGLAENIPILASQAIGMLEGFIYALIENVPLLIDAALQLVQGLIDGLNSALPLLLDAAVFLFTALVDAIPVVVEQLLQALPDIITNICNFLTTSIPLIVDAAIQMLMGIIEAIPDIIQAIVVNLPQIIMALVDGLTGAVPQIVQASITLLMGIIDAIPDIVVAIVQNLPQIITAIVTSLAYAVPEIFSAAKDLLWQIIKAVPTIVAGIGEAVGEIITGIVGGLFGGESSVKDAALNLGSKILDGVKGIYTNITETVSNIVYSASEVFSELPGRISTWLTETVNNVIAWGVEMITNAAMAASDFINEVITFISELPNKIAYWLGYAIGTVIKWGLDLASWVTTEIPKIIDNIVTFFSELPGKIWTWLVDTVNKVVQWGANLYSTASTCVTNTINAVVSFFAELPGKVWTWLVDTVNKVIQWGANLLSAASTAAQNAINKVVEWFQQLPGKVWTWLVNTITKVTQFAADLAAKASSAAQGFVTKLVDGVSGLPDKFREIGSNIVDGIWNGISAGWTWLVDKVKGLADSLFQGAKDALGINSPSKLFDEGVGRWIPPGIGVGIEKAMPDLQKQMDAEMEALVDRMQLTVAVETNGITVRSRAKAEHQAATEYPQETGDTYYDNHIDQTNNYHVPVVTPAEASKAQREAARKLLGGVK